MKEQIQKDYITAFKEKDNLKKEVLSLLKGAIQNAEINKKESLTDEEIIDIIVKQIKLRNDGINEFRKANRTELIGKYESEINILNKYMPAQLSEEEINTLIDEIINEVKPEGIKDFGKIMKEITPKVKGRADMSYISSKIKEKL